MAVFDSDKGGTVNCQEFLLRFSIMGFQARNMLRVAERVGGVGPYNRFERMACRLT